MAEVLCSFKPTEILHLLAFFGQAFKNCMCDLLRSLSPCAACHLVKLLDDASNDEHLSEWTLHFPSQVSQIIFIQACRPPVDWLQRSYNYNGMTTVATLELLYLQSSWCRPQLQLLQLFVFTARWK